jgi:tRNA uridine 5-carboxymethylaminomethyl modification enzyme
MAGINAAQRVRREEAVVLDRSQAYIGVLIDDLVTKGTNEPYRMFTSRVEYRLVIREDNADERLTPLGHRLGLIPDADFRKFREKETQVELEMKRLQDTRIAAKAQNQAVLKARRTTPFTGKALLLDLLRRPEISYPDLMAMDPATRKIPRAVRERVEVNVKYAGYIRRQTAEIEQFKHLENIRIPKGFSYQGLPGISLEVAEKLTSMQPQNLGQAGRISGITPGALSQLVFHIHKLRQAEKA